MSEPPDWDNLGYWQSVPTSYTAAAEDLARRVWRLAAPVASPRVLDVGAGYGEQLGLWRSCGAEHILALERNASRARQAMTRWSADPGIEVRAADAQHVAELAPASRDLVVVIDALYHFPARAAFFADARRVLKPGGRLAFSTLAGPEGAGARAGLVRGLTRAFEMPSGLPSTKSLRSELTRAGFEDVRVDDWSRSVLDGFAAHGSRSLRPGDDPRRRIRVAATRAGCRAGSVLGLRYVGVAATAAESTGR